MHYYACDFSTRAKSPQPNRLRVLFCSTTHKGREAPLLHALVFVCPFPGKYGIIARENPYGVILCRLGLIGAKGLELGERFVFVK